jgi:hypothetical protein
VLLDELVLEDGRFLLAAGDDRVEVGAGAPQHRDEVAGVARAGLEVAAHTRAQALRLADVESLAVLVEEEVAAGRGRQMCELARERFAQPVGEVALG